jgi:hypothetical protein
MPEVELLGIAEQTQQFKFLFSKLQYAICYAFVQLVSVEQSRFWQHHAVS